MASESKKKVVRRKTAKQLEKAAPVIENSSPEKEIKGSAAVQITWNEVFKALLAGYGKADDTEAKKQFANLLSSRLKQIAGEHGCFNDYNIIVLFDSTSMIKGDADRIYEAVSKIATNGKPLLMILLSNGGEPGPAYLIGKLCRESCNGKFVVSVPRHAKSAATILATAADEIHMGSLSELGPIDPQIKRMPALGLKNAIEHIADLVAKNPDSSEMFAKYLKLTVEPVAIGHYEREAESIVQYAERLLQTHVATLSRDPKEIAHRLVYEYKDHGFVIDKAEAEDIFSNKTVKSNSAEYNIGNAIYMELTRVKEIAAILDYTFYFIGSLDSEPQLISKS